MNLLKTGRKPAIVLAVGLGAAIFALPSHAAHVLVDNFETSQAELAVVTGSGTETAFSSVSGAGIIGGERDIILMADPDSPGATSTVSVDGSLFRLANDSQASSTVTVQWDGLDNDSGLNLTGLGGIDMTAAGRNAIEFGIAFDDRPATLEFAVYSLDGAVSIATLDTAGWIETPTTMAIRFSDFVGLADFTSIGAIELTLTSSLNALDFELSHIETVTVVPIPGAVWFLSSALLSIGFAGRRKRA